MINKLKKEGYLEINSSFNKDYFDMAAKSFIAFTKQENINSIKFKIGFNDDYGNDKGIVLGYTKKFLKSGDLDEKEFFHYNPKIEELFNFKSQTTESFLAYCRNIYSESTKLCKKILLELTNDFPNIYDDVFDKNGNSFNVLRFLKYKAPISEKFNAKGHYDKGLCTLALAESSPGLRIGLNSDNLIDISTRENKSIFFPSLLIREFTNNQLKPIWHDVIQNKEYNTTEYNRWAIVYFVTPKKIPRKISFEDAHTPLN